MASSNNPKCEWCGSAVDVERAFYEDSGEWFCHDGCRDSWLCDMEDPATTARIAKLHDRLETIREKATSKPCVRLEIRKTASWDDAVAWAKRFQPEFEWDRFNRHAHVRFYPDNRQGTFLLDVPKDEVDDYYGDDAELIACHEWIVGEFGDDVEWAF